MPLVTKGVHLLGTLGSSPAPGYGAAMLRVAEELDAVGLRLCSRYEPP
jgi:hypothetical protein